MFLDSSRYAQTPTDTVRTDDGREVEALRLRALPLTKGNQRLVSENDRLDVIAGMQFGDSTRFWHIADANSALEASDLVARVLASFNVPRS